MLLSETLQVLLRLRWRAELFEASFALHPGPAGGAVVELKLAASAAPMPLASSA